MKVAIKSVVIMLMLGFNLSYAQFNIADKLKSLQKNVDSNIGSVSQNQESIKADARSKPITKTGNFVLGDENSILVWSYDLDPSSEFKKMPKGLDRNYWISNAGDYWEPPASITDEELDKFQATYYNQLFKVINGPKLRSAYANCKASHLKAADKALNAIQENINQARTKNQKAEMQRSYDDVKVSAVPFSQAWCGFKLLKATLYTLNVPNYAAEQNRGSSYRYAYEELWVGQIYRAVNSLVRGDLTDQFYQDVAGELNLSADQWLEATANNLAGTGQNKLRSVNLMPYVERIMQGYVKQVATMEYFIAVKKSVNP